LRIALTIGIVSLFFPLSPFSFSYTHFISLNSYPES